MIFNSMPTEDQIRAVAHQIWIDEGQPDGRAEIHWEWALAKFRNAAPTDVSLIDGIGPKIASALAKAGFTSLQQIAALDAKGLEALDTKLALKGRAVREEWVAQAQELVAGKAPRAKVDQAKAAKAKA
ncbi:MAG: DUF2934 domain-containing protein [Alphaproteobacteria bacterium]|nr:DUF2934 domain-containing protein [Alphaproteobacteria bacterium]